MTFSTLEVTQGAGWIIYLCTVLPNVDSTSRERVPATFCLSCRCSNSELQRPVISTLGCMLSNWILPSAKTVTIHSTCWDFDSTFEIKKQFWCISPSRCTTNLICVVENVAVVEKPPTGAVTFDVEVQTSDNLVHVIQTYPSHSHQNRQYHLNIIRARF